MSPDDDDFLSVYLRDHYAGASGGSRLAGRIAKAHEDDPDGADLMRLASDVEEDRSLLLEIMGSLGIQPSPMMNAAAEAGELVGRLKPNGRLLSRSALTDVVEYELMRLGVIGKLNCWRALRLAAQADPRLSTAALDGLIERAESQHALLARRWLSAVATAFG